MYVTKFAPVAAVVKSGVIVDQVACLIQHRLWPNHTLYQAEHSFVQGTHTHLGETQIWLLTQSYAYPYPLYLLSLTARVLTCRRGTDFDDPGDVLVDADCHYTANTKAYFGADKGDIRLHSGFYRAWQALESGVTAAIHEQLTKVRHSHQFSSANESIDCSIQGLTVGGCHLAWMRGCSIASDYTDSEVLLHVCQCESHEAVSVRTISAVSGTSTTTCM